jgi:hypothetical protein
VISAHDLNQLIGDPTVERRRIPWEPSPHGGPLGRHVNHDPRSRNYRVARRAQPLRSVLHRRLVPVYDQGEIGDCVPHAGKGALSTRPFRHRFTSEAGIIATYSELTRLDDVPGSYPPDDTGSDGLSFGKLAVTHRWCTSYRHAFGIDDHLTGLQTLPAIVGTDWLDGMDRPDPDGRVHPTGDVRGGHEYECSEYAQRGTTRNDTEDRLWFWQSWGPRWGLAGRFYITVADFAALLERQGDSTFLVP